MRIVTVARKPVEGTVVGNVIAHGCGAVNVDGCRVLSATPPKPTTAPGWDSVNAKNAEHGYRPGAYAQGAATYVPHRSGRWPANLIIQRSAAMLGVADEMSPFFRRVGP